MKILAELAMGLGIVNRVIVDRITDVVKMNADLMSAARFKDATDKGVISVTF